MIWRLTYCNKDGVEARLDIIRGASTPIEVIEGTANPFLLSYKMDKPDKSGFFMTSSADISIFETPTFNIDNLKTSSETEIKVEHYINGVLDWSGFVIPDFFSKTIGSPATVEMVASDRLGTLKGVTLDDLNQYVSMRDLAVKCLAKTGLTLPLYTMADFVNNSQTNAFFKALGLEGRLSDTKGRNISCYDILKSILVASNSKLVQQSGAWYIVNKFQYEQGSGNLFSTLTASTAYSEQTVNFSNVHAGARRTIIPVGATTGVFQEFGGGRIYPDNFDFADGLSGWTLNDGFNVTTGNKEVKNYVAVYDAGWARYYDEPYLEDYTVKPYLIIRDIDGAGVAYLPYMQKVGVPIVSNDRRTAKIKAEIVSTGLQNTRYRVEVILNTGTKTLYLDSNGAFTEEVKGLTVDLSHEDWQPSIPATRVVTFEGAINALEDEDNVNNYTLTLKVFGAGRYDSSSGQVSYFNTYLLHSFAVTYDSVNESGKGLVYRRNQGTGFTKEHDIDTAIFGDYMRKGLDGYFYEYRIDDTSSLYSTAGILTQPLWTAYNDTEQLPLLQHVTRQKSRMFSVAHNMISARIDVTTFKPLSIFVDCNSVNPRHVVVSATYDFLRSEVEVELEQIAYATLDVREYIYSYFGDGESGISSVGGVSGGGTGTGGGGGMTGSQLEILTNLADWWKLDEENDAIYSEKSVYSLKGVSALGFNDDGGGGSGGGVDMLDAWANYTVEKENYYVPASLLVPFRNDTLSRLTSLEAGGSGGDVEISVTGSGNAVTGVSKSGNTLTFAKSNTFALSTHNHDTIYKPIGYAPTWSEVTGKPTTFAPSAHTHSASDITSGTLPIARIPTGTTGTTVALGNHLHTGVYEPVFTKNNAFNKDFGTTTGTVAQGNDSRILNGQTAYSWGDHTSAGYALNSALTTHINKVDNPHAVTTAQIGAVDLTTNQTITGAKTFSTLLTASAGINTPKVDFGNGFTIEPSGAELVFKYNGVIKQRMLSDGTILATGGITALST